MKSTSLTSEEIASLTRKGLIKPRIAPDQQPHAPGCHGATYALPDAPGRIDPKHVIMTVAQAWGVEVEEITASRGDLPKSKTPLPGLLPGASRPYRIACAKILRHALGLRPVQVAQILGKTSQSTIVHSNDRFTTLYHTDLDFLGRFNDAARRVCGFCTCGLFEKFNTASWQEYKPTEKHAIQSKPETQQQESPEWKPMPAEKTTEWIKFTILIQDTNANRVIAKTFPGELRKSAIKFEGSRRIYGETTKVYTTSEINEEAK